MIIPSYRYKGYLISQAYRDLTPAESKNGILVGSAIQGKVQISGPGAECLRVFTQEGAKSYINFLIRFKMNRPFHEMYGDRGKPRPKYYGLTKKEYDEIYG